MKNCGLEQSNTGTNLRDLIICDFCGCEFFSNDIYRKVEDVGFVCFPCLKEEDRFHDLYLEVLGKNVKKTEEKR